MTKALSALFLGLFLTALAGCPSVQKGKRAPDFSLPEIGTNKKVKLSEINSQKPVLIVFWATWCPSCMEEIPLLNDLYDRGSSKLEILAVNVQESKNIIQDFLKKRPVKYRILQDSMGEIAMHYNVEGLPTSVLLAKGGEILYYGYELPRHLIDDMLKEPS